ncbi:phage tail tape measure protein [Geodermatophilus chilensis]|uniref:phage tail tape measure protein n=1 Tax=Geodermatophilus chilensis TaxID=2035835 RepID=UPI000C25D75B|nr:phage tail tape measure protein [Geodermatophilus chilensis]
MSRVLETVLTGRNLLSPVLAQAGRDVATYSATVTGANEKAAAGATASARAQQAAAGQVTAASTRATDAVVSGSTRQTAARRAQVQSATALAAAENAASSAVVSANTRLSGAVSGTTATYQRSAASLREKLGLQALDGEAAARSAAVNSRAAQSAAGFTAAIDGQSTALGRESVTTAANTTATRANATAREQATLAARTQQSAATALAGSNALLGTSLTPLTAGLGAVTLGFGYAAYRGMDFDRSMSAVAAASQASGAELGRLRQAALDAGASTQYSATEAAAGITELSKAGVQTADILDGGLTGALNLAAAGQLEVADAAEIGATALSVFGLEGSQMSHVADLLAAGAGKAQGSVYDLGMALNQSALVANQTGLSIEDTAGALALFASNGLVGSDAGTSFKTMLQALTPNSAAAANAMESLGITAYDSQGAFIGLEAYAGKLRGALAGMSEEQRNATLETIFGSDAVRAASVLYSAGAEGVAEWTAKVNDQGFATRQASQLTDNLAGDLERLGGAADTFFTELGAGTQGALREAVQALTAIVDAGGDAIGFFTSLPGPVQVAILALGGVAALKGPVSGAFDRMAAAVLGWSLANEGAVSSTGRLRGAAAGLLGVFGGPWGLAIAGVVTGVSLLASVLGDSSDSSDDAASSADNLTAALEQTKGAIDDTVRAAAAKDLVDNGLNDWARRLGIDVTVMTDAILGVPGALDEVNGAFDTYIGGQRQDIVDATGAINAGFTDQGIAARDARAAFGELAGATGETVTKQQEIAAATAATGDAMNTSLAQTQAAQQALTDWIEEQAKIGSSFIEPLDVYKGLLDDKMAKERESAEATAAATASSEDSWRDYVGDVTVSLDEYATKLEEQILAQENWRANVVTVTQRGGLEVGQILADMGVEGAQITAQMATATEGDFQRMKDALIREAHLGGSGAATELSNQMRVMEAVGRDGAGATALAISQQLGIGADEVSRIAAQYGVNLASGLNPIMESLGKNPIQALASGRMGVTTRLFQADGGVMDFYANGGVEDHVAQIARPGDWRVWAEPETGGEAYIPLAPAKRDRSLDIWRETGRRLGVDVQAFASGGFAIADDVPRPPSTAPYQAPISTAGDATMQRGYDEATAWMREHSPGLAGGSFGVGKRTPNGVGGLGPAAAAARAFVMKTFGVTNIGGYSYRTIAGTKTLSDHALGKAIDVMIPNYKSAASIALGNRIASHFVTNPGQFGTKYVIWRDQINSGRGWGPYGHPGGGRSDTLQHRDHVHVSLYDRGGLVRPGLSLVDNRTGGNEHMAVFTQPQWSTLQRLANAEAAAQFAAPAPGYAAAAMPGYGASPAAGAAGVPLRITVAAAPVAVYLDGQEWRGMARVEAETVVVDAFASTTDRGRLNG